MEVAAIAHKANFMNLRAIIDITSQMLRTLPTLGVEVSQWDPFINLIIELKLDDETKAEWKQHKGLQGKSNSKEFLDWLETRAIELQPSHNERLSRMLKGDIRKGATRKIFQMNPAPRNETPPKPPTKCLVCGGNQKVRDCPKLRKECAKARTNRYCKNGKTLFQVLIKAQIWVLRPRGL